MENNVTLFIENRINDPYYNLALEEYLLKSSEEYFVVLWRNSPAVIVGINQNAAAEVDFSFTEANGIKVVRRITGGGAVYHDLGNICYTVISPFDGLKDNYRVFTDPVITFLKTLGVNAEFSGRNDITVDGKKISGNAQTVYKNRILHHGTLLFDTDMTVLSRALIPNKLKIQSKGIKSVRARVTNLCDYITPKMTADEFFARLCGYFEKFSRKHSLSQADISAVRLLAEQKYSTYGWNVGYSPKAEHNAEGRFDFGCVGVAFDEKNGIIANAKIFGDFFSKNDVNVLASKLNGCRLIKNELMAALSQTGEFIDGASAEQIVSLIV